jgi:hypothetical protein
MEFHQPVARTRRVKGQGTAATEQPARTRRALSIEIRRAKHFFGMIRKRGRAGGDSKGGGKRASGKEPGA